VIKKNQAIKERKWRKDEKNIGDSGIGLHFADFTSFSLYRLHRRK